MFSGAGVLLTHAIWDFVVVLPWGVGGSGMGHQNSRSLSKIQQPFRLTLNSTVRWLTKGYAGVSKIAFLERPTKSLGNNSKLGSLQNLYTMTVKNVSSWRAWFGYLHEVLVLKQFLLAVSASEGTCASSCLLRRRVRMLKGPLLALVWGIPPKEMGALGRWQVPVAFPVTWPKMQWPARLGWPRGRLIPPSGASRRGGKACFRRGRPVAGLWLSSGSVPGLVAGQCIAVSILTSNRSSSNSCLSAALKLRVQ